MATYRLATAYRNGAFYRRGETTTPGSVAHRVTCASGWGQAAAGAFSRSFPWHGTAPQSLSPGMPWGELEPEQHLTSLATTPVQAAGDAIALRWEDTAEHLGRTTALQMSARRAGDTGARLPWADHQGQHAAGAAATWDSPAAQGQSVQVPWDALAAHAMSKSLLWRRIVERGGYVALPWSPIGARSSSTVVAWPPTPPDTGDTIHIPELPVYVMIPTLTAVRLPDRTPIPLLAVTIEEELGGFVWSFTAPMGRSGLGLVNPDDGTLPQIEIAVNGHVWTFVVDAYSDTRKFGANACILQGRSLGALLAAPHAPTRTHTQESARNASQLADEELPVGWTLLWDAVDWLVPGGTFSYGDLAPIDAIAQVASAIGAAVQSDPALPKLVIAPTYDASPWAWDGATPYAIIPAAVISQGSSSWKGGINPTGVYVYAQNAGSGALVKLAGTDGAVQLPMVVDPLLVHADAQRERGRHELAANGRARSVQRTVPLFPTPAPEGMPNLGVVRPGRLVEIEDVDETWRGMVTSVRIDAQRNGRALTVRQILTIERQYR